MFILVRDFWGFSHGHLLPCLQACEGENIKGGTHGRIKLLMPDAKEREEKERTGTQHSRQSNDGLSSSSRYCYC